MDKKVADSRFSGLIQWGDELLQEITQDMTPETPVPDEVAALCALLARSEKETGLEVEQMVSILMAAYILGQRSVLDAK